MAIGCDHAPPAPPEGKREGQRTGASELALSREHLAAVDRHRRVIVNYDTNFGAPAIGRRLAGMDLDSLVDAYFSLIDGPEIRIDGIWWCWLDGNYANYPSKVLPMWDLPGFRKWWDAGIDPVPWSSAGEEATGRLSWRIPKTGERHG